MKKIISALFLFLITLLFLNISSCEEISSDDSSLNVIIDKYINNDSGQLDYITNRAFFSNDYSIELSDIHGYTKINNLINYRYFVLKHFEYFLDFVVSNDIVIDGSLYSEHTNYINSNFVIYLQTTTNYYFTNVLITNDHDIETSNNSNHYVAHHGSISGYTTFNNLLNYKYYVLKTNGYRYTLINDSDDNLGYSNYRGTSIDIITNYYFTNALSTNDNNIETSNNSNHYVTHHGSISGYTTFNDLLNYKYYVLKTNGYRYTLINDSDDNLGYSNYRGTSIDIITNYYFTNALSTNANANFMSGSGGITNWYKEIIQNNNIVGYGKLYVSFINVINLRDDGSVNTGTLNGNHSLTVGSQNVTFNGVGINSFRRIYFYSNGAVSSGYLNGNQPLNIGSQNVTFKDQKRIAFHDNGSVDSGFLSGNQSLTVGSQNVTFKDNRQIAFHSSGNIVNGFLNGNQSFTIGGQSISLNNNIYFDNNGNINYGNLNGNHSLNIGSYQNVSLSGSIRFYSNGNVSSGILIGNQSFTIGSQSVSLNGGISFYANGKIWQAKLNGDRSFVAGGRDVTFNGEGSDFKRSIYFYENSNVKSGYLNVPSSFYIVIGNNILLGGQAVTFRNTISFHSNGRVWQGELNGDQTINHTAYHDGDQIRFNENGIIVEVDHNHDHDHDH